MGTLIRVKICKQVSTGFENSMEMIDGFVEQRWPQKLKTIPYQRAVEGASLLGESLNQKAIYAGGIALILVVISITKTIFEGGKEIFRVKTRAKLGHELNIGGVGTTKIEKPKLLVRIE